MDFTSGHIYPTYLPHLEEPHEGVYPSKPSTLGDSLHYLSKYYEHALKIN